jgi:hypothetical protein
MNHETENQKIKDTLEVEYPKKSYMFPASILISSIILASAWVYTTGSKANGLKKTDKAEISQTSQLSALGEVVLPSDGVILPVSWGNLGARLISVGAIDEKKFKAVYDQSGEFTEEYKNLLLGQNNSKLKITKENSAYLLNLFWALGLASKNEILEDGEMMDPLYRGAGNFASTGGWTIAVGNPMDHYSKHQFFNLSPEQQAKVDKISRGIYRPWCGNPTHFPDCNHGMAMLGLLELMASQDVSEEDMWGAALAVNSYWFPDTYVTIATYMKNKGIEWKDVSPQEVLGANYSSASGYRRIATQITVRKDKVEVEGAVLMP